MNSEHVEVLRRVADELRRADALANKSDKIDRLKVIGRAANNNLSVILSAIEALSAPKHKAGDNMEDEAGHVQGSEWVLVPREKLEQVADGIFSKHHNAEENKDAYDVAYFGAMLKDVEEMLSSAPKPKDMNITTNSIATTEVSLSYLKCVDSLLVTLTKNAAHCFDVDFGELNQALLATTTLIQKAEKDYASLHSRSEDQTTT